MLCLEWMRNCFESKIKHIFCADYSILIVDRHAFFTLTEFIQFKYKYKIVCLYLLVHFTYLLKPLDVDIFDFLK